MIVTLMTFKSYHDHTLPIFSDLKILNLHKLNDYLTCQFMFQYFSFRNLPQIFTDYFLTNKNTHNYNTRNCNRTNYRKRTLAYKGIDLWNNLPLHQRQIRSCSLFKTTTKKYILHLK